MSFRRYIFKIALFVQIEKKSKNLYRARVCDAYTKRLYETLAHGYVFRSERADFRVGMRSAVANAYLWFLTKKQTNKQNKVIVLFFFLFYYRPLISRVRCPVQYKTRPYV